jgi:hypothetical protein
MVYAVFIQNKLIYIYYNTYAYYYCIDLLIDSIRYSFISCVTQALVRDNERQNEYQTGIRYTKRYVEQTTGLTCLMYK